MGTLNSTAERVESAPIPVASNGVAMAHGTDHDATFQDLAGLAPIEPDEFLEAITVNHETANQAVQPKYLDDDGVWQFGKVRWHDGRKPFAKWAADWGRGRENAYVSVFAFGDLLNKKKNRSREIENAIAARALAYDVDVGDTHAKPGYAEGQAAFEGIKKFADDTGIVPTHVNETGTGGWHPYYLLDNLIDADEFKELGGRLKALKLSWGLEIDKSVGANPSQVMRLPGSINSKTGEVVKAYRWREAPYTVGELRGLIERAEAKLRKDDDSADDDKGVFVTDTPPPNTKASSPAKRETPNDRDRDWSKISGPGGCPIIVGFVAGEKQSEPEWHFSANVASYCRDGLSPFLRYSKLDPRFNETEARQKFDIEVEQDKHPQLCGRFDQCGSCAHMGVIKTPVQLGDREPSWLSEMNQRYAQARDGNVMRIIDFETVEETKHGTHRAFGYLDESAFRAYWRGRDLVKVGDKMMSRADAWLQHKERRSYEALAFNPGADLGPKVLNLWPGFAIEPREGDAGPWLDMVEKAFPDKEGREYLINWLSWKVQHPGGVPGTALVCLGPKGAGKNSTFEPLLAAFGRHALVCDNSELVAGRFTGHLRYVAFCLLDEAVFVGDPKQNAAIKARTTGVKTTHEAKGKDAAPGFSRCAYVSLTNSEHAWQATMDERRSAVLEASGALIGAKNAGFWKDFYRWLEYEGGNETVLHYLLHKDLTGFKVAEIPRGEALRRQQELTALKDPYTAWMADALDTGVIAWRAKDGGARTEAWHDARELLISRSNLLDAYVQSDPARRARFEHGTSVQLGAKLAGWFGKDLDGGRLTIDGERDRTYLLPCLLEARIRFRKATGICTGGLDW